MARGSKCLREKGEVSGVENNEKEDDLEKAAPLLR